MTRNRIQQLIVLTLTMLLVGAPGSVAFAQDEGEAPPPAEEAPPEVPGEEGGEGEGEGEEGELVEAEAEEVEEVEEFDPAVFDKGLALFYEREFGPAAAYFWEFVDRGEQTLDNYEWAQYFLAESLRALGFWHAAVNFYYIVAKTRSRPEILPEALGRLEAISRRRPFSESLVFEDLLYDSEFGSLNPKLNDWIEYVQGLNDYKNDFIDWGDLHFSRISKDSYYALQATYVKAVYALKKNQDDRAQVYFEKIIESGIDRKDIINRSNMSMARLLFDLGAYKEALEHYNRVEQINLSHEQAQLLLEKAWTNYNLGNLRRAMGLLHALQAPSYQRYFLPDAFVLRALIYKDLCHFIPAKRVARAFRFDYGRTLDDLRARKPMERSIRLFDGATQEGNISRRTILLKTLQKERLAIEDWDSTWEDSGLDAHLRRLYDLEVREQARLWKLQFDRLADEKALELLETEEQINLLEYEIGLDIFKRIKSGSLKQAREERLVVPYDSRNVYYEFDHEYWNDELHSYQFFITSRCFETEE